jgi:hypothetical protein
MAEINNHIRNKKQEIHSELQPSKFATEGPGIGAVA